MVALRRLSPAAALGLFAWPPAATATPGFWHSASPSSASGSPRVPKPATSWASFIQLARAGKDPKADYTRNGNWTHFDCTDPVVADFLYYTPSERWQLMGTDAARDDVIRIWKNTDRLRVGSTTQLAGEQDCGDIVTESCNTIQCETGADGDASGPAAQFIWNSLAEIHNMYAQYYDNLFWALSIVSTTLNDMENKFAPLPPKEDDTWLPILVDMITLGVLGTAGPFFNTMFKQRDWFAGKTGSALDNAKDAAMALIAQSTTITRDALLGGDQATWTPEKQDKFSAYLGQVVYGLSNSSSRGSNEAIDALYGAMSDGKLIEDSNGNGPLPATGDARYELFTNINKCIIGFALPALWRQSGLYTFILDAGHACNEDKDLSNYLDKEMMNATGVCVDNWQYYLAYPDGDAKTCTCKQYDSGPCQRVCRDSKFSAPKGIEYISGGENYGGITTTELVKGSVRTWMGNGRQNGARVADPANPSTLAGLMDVDVTTPGFMRMPVCSPARALQSWKTAKKDSSPNWPCNIPPGQDKCGDSTFVDQTSHASPKVEDCRQLITNIEGDGGSGWTTQVIGHHQRRIASHASCHFGVEATKTDGNVNFKVGGQDVIDIINDAIARFARDGLIGAKGKMNCDGNIKGQPVLWGIY
ncbi:hypothetical protein BO94DRAFT_557986 [Aspergillus sclerotioniger CBS 115572]|uniref:Ecp2 effector protein-like domain-containing protein n=1 Tax=Aspergillus sclerotioniger CBS 115572 TaxID=1450535 RepID=A0A317W898_9EURO|nr:hypothetical protein BO94DRAFT_557986 [Aspergillus sclerotioniger CBS 115572]PWY81537.1 hypothetical protein BO94DRAFT_557986 [Aspergillus sclerotioniger CBS 115572]